MEPGETGAKHHGARAWVNNIKKKCEEAAKRRTYMELSRDPSASAHLQQSPGHIEKECTHHNEIQRLQTEAERSQKRKQKGEEEYSKEIDRHKIEAQKIKERASERRKDIRDKRFTSEDKMQKMIAVVDKYEKKQNVVLELSKKTNEERMEKLRQEHLAAEEALRNIRTGYSTRPSPSNVADNLDVVDGQEELYDDKLQQYKEDYDGQEFAFRDSSSGSSYKENVKKTDGFYNASGSCEKGGSKEGRQ